MRYDSYEHLLQSLSSIDPLEYGKSRNDVDGGVTRLSPFISRGVLSTRLVTQTILSCGHDPKRIESFLQQLAWRDYFQRVWMHLGENIHQDIKQKQDAAYHNVVPKALLKKETGIEVIDEALKEFETSGHLHNHLRLYIASIVCNIGRYHWKAPANWMYYHLLDADWASNALSWQWVAGSFSSKKYYANQENINRYTKSNQQHTFLDAPYEAFPLKEIPKVLQEQTTLPLQTDLSRFPKVISLAPKSVCVYNFYQLDPTWKKEEDFERVLLLEPEVFKKNPISNNTLDWMMTCSRHIPGLKIVCASFEEAFKHHTYPIHYKEHPLNRHYKGVEHPRAWMFPEVEGYYPSFFAYWKQCQKHFKQLIQ